VSNVRSHLKNVTSLLVSGAASKIIVFLATVQIIKGLSVPDNGVYQVAYSLGFIYSIFAELGVRGYLLRELSRARDDPLQSIHYLVIARLSCGSDSGLRYTRCSTRLLYY
jgi:O-antigen/teichoic acid export membrane protein